MTGVMVFRTHSILLDDMEKWVQSVADRSGQQIHWYNISNVYIVRTEGDVKAVKEAIKELKSEHDELFLQTCTSGSCDEALIPGQILA